MLCHVVFHHHYVISCHGRFRDSMSSCGPGRPDPDEEVRLHDFVSSSLMFCYAVVQGRLIQTTKA